MQFSCIRLNSHILHINRFATAEVSSMTAITLRFDIETSVQEKRSGQL